MVEQRHQPFLEQRQPMVHACLPPAVRHRLIERVAGGIGTEQIAIAGAEPLDTLFIEQGFGSGQQQQFVRSAARSLIGGVEPAQRLDLVAKEIEAIALLVASREQVDDAAAHRIFAMIGNGIDPGIAVRGEQFGEPVAVHPCSGMQPC
jgi:hypothetical protein